MGDARNAILVIDDDELVRRSLRRSLGLIGQEAMTEAPTAEVGLEELGKGDFAFALIDLRMPGMGGHEAIRKMCQSHPLVPLVGMSGHADINDVIECLRDGAVDFLVKPWTTSELNQVVARTLSKRDARLEQQALVKALKAAGGGAANVPAATSSATAPSATLHSILARLRTGEIALPSQPSVALIVRRLLSRGDASAEQLRELIERDPHLAGRVLRIANSPQYCAVGRVSDLRTAIARIGNREIGMVVESLIARRFYQVSSAAAKQHLDALWQHSCARAVCMRLLAKLISGLDVEAAYMAGLFCDAGAAFLIRTAEELGSKLDAAELATIAEKHAAVSATIATAWEMPASVIEACRTHQDKTRAAERPQLANLAALAELICSELSLPADFAPIDVPGDLLERYQLGPQQLDQLRKQTAELLRKSKELLA